MAKNSFKVAEIFGPTLQGEGPSAGLPVCFVRFGGCDFRCKWCDSLHAVLPEEVRILPSLTVEEIVRKLENLIGERRGFRRVVFSGGNPLIWDLTPLVTELRKRGWWMAVETQGSIYREWIDSVDEIIISPKGPSSGMNQSADTVGKFLKHLSFLKTIVPAKAHFKFVVFTREDLEYAYQTIMTVQEHEMYLSVGTDPTDTTENLLLKMERIWGWIQEDYHHLSIKTYLGMQLHVLLWGHARAV